MDCYGLSVGQFTHHPDLAATLTLAARLARDITLVRVTGDARGHGAKVDTTRPRNDASSSDPEPLLSQSHLTPAQQEEAEGEQGETAWFGDGCRVRYRVRLIQDLRGDLVITLLLHSDEVDRIRLYRRTRIRVGGEGERYSSVARLILIAAKNI